MLPRRRLILERALSLCAITLLAILCSPAILTLAGNHIQLTENRASTPRPKLKDGWQIASNLGSYIKDRLSLRSTAVEIDSWIDVHVFGEDPAFGGSSSPRVISGGDDFLFLADAIDVACAPNLEPSLTGPRLAAVMSAISGSGRKVASLVAPDKSTIFPDLLPRNLVKQECFDAYTRNLWKSIESSGVDGYIDVRKALMAAREENFDSLYLRRDSHWDNSGSLVAVREIIKSLDSSLWNDEEVKREGTLSYVGDLTSLRGRPEPDTAPKIVISRPGVREILNETLPSKGAPESRHIKNASTQARLIKGKTLMFGDSFGFAALDQLKPFFEDLKFIRIADFDSSHFATLVNNSDFVIVESVERSLGYRMAMEFGSDEFVNYLHNALVPHSG